MRRLLPLLGCLGLLACPAPTPTPDAGEQEDAGVDAGAPDAGRPPRDAGVPDAGFTAAPVEQWCALQALASCARDERCGRLGDAGAADCLALGGATARCDQLAYTRAVREGRLQYLESEAVRCLNGYASGSCALPPAACATVFQGLVPADGGCVLREECDDSQGFCDLYDNRCPHRCRAWTPQGEACDNFFTRCDPLVGSCDTADAGGATLCLPRKAEGDPCTRFDACGDDMACSGGTCITRRAARGEACSLRNGFPFCDTEHFCRQAPGAPGTCERKAGLGGTCTGPGSCLPSLRCSTLITTGTCLEKAGPGEGCIAWDDCEDGLYCDARLQRCERLPGPGGDCTFQVSGYRCRAGSACAFSSTSDDRCVAQKAAGEPCGYTAECLSNDCEWGLLADGGYGGTCLESCSQRADGGP